MSKKLLLLGAPNGTSAKDFKDYYLNVHAKKLAADDKVIQYIANTIEDPTQDLLDAGWGGENDTGILAIDEVEYMGTDIITEYDDKIVVIGDYDVNHLVMRPSSAAWELGKKSPIIKRIGLLKCFDDQRQEDFFQFWQFIHAPKALFHHIGAGKYIQYHFINTIKSAPTVWNGICMLSYWSVDAFRFGHFSRPDSMAIVKDDATHFMDRYLGLLGEDYVMKRGEA